jgi:poly(3-hydroxyalkanoate) synthetase
MPMPSSQSTAEEFYADLKSLAAEEWLAGATQRWDSWWPLWQGGVAQYGGGKG